MNKVLQMPASPYMTPEQALDSAKGLSLTDVLIVGYDTDGDLVIRSSRMGRADALWLAEKMKAWALGG